GDAAGRRREVLVEGAVGREKALPQDRLKLPGGAEGAGVVEIAIEPGNADQRDDSTRLTGEHLRLRLRRLHEARPQKQIFGRVAGHSELGEDDEVSMLLLRLRESRADPLPMLAEVADD